MIIRVAELPCAQKLAFRSLPTIPVFLAYSSFCHSLLLLVFPLGQTDSKTHGRMQRGFRNCCIRTGKVQRRGAIEREKEGVTTQLFEHR